MKSKVQIAVAVLVLIAAAYWSYTTIRPYAYTGANIMFPVGSGYAIVKNTGDDPMPIEMRSGERVASFRIASSDLGLTAASTRQGTGRSAYHTLSFDLPPGQARIDITNGSGVMMIARGETRVEATVRPASANTVRWVLILSGGASLWALYYISRATDHRWIGALRGKASGGNLQPKQTTT